MSKIINKYNIVFFAIAFASGIFLFITPQPVGATTSGYVCSDGDYDPYESIPGMAPGVSYEDVAKHAYGKCKDGSTPAKITNSCEGVKTNIIDCESSGGEDIEDSGLWNLLLTAINILSAGIGIAAVGGVVYSAVLYSSAGGSPDNIKKAKERLVNIGIGIVAYILMYSLLNYLIPGGIFN